MNAQGNIEKVQATPNNKWGGCLVRTDANYGCLNCSPNWIAVDCEGVVGWRPPNRQDNVVLMLLPSYADRAT